LVTIIDGILDMTIDIHAGGRNRHGPQDATVREPRSSQ
jgi:hypothetical protein